MDVYRTRPPEFANPTRAQLQLLLGLSSKEIGQLGGGRRKRKGTIDLAMIQSLKAVDDLEALFGVYGQIVVDECHHLPAVSFEASVRRAPVRHFLGLTATPVPTRRPARDRHHAVRADPPPNHEQ